MDGGNIRIYIYTMQQHGELNHVKQDAQSSALCVAFRTLFALSLPKRACAVPPHLALRVTNNDNNNNNTTPGVVRLHHAFCRVTRRNPSRVGLAGARRGARGEGGGAVTRPRGCREPNPCGDHSGAGEGAGGTGVGLLDDLQGVCVRARVCCNSIFVFVVATACLILMK